MSRKLLHSESDMTVLFSATSKLKMWMAPYRSWAKPIGLSWKSTNFGLKREEQTPRLVCCQLFWQSGGWNVALWADTARQYHVDSGASCSGRSRFSESCLGFPFGFLLAGTFVIRANISPSFPAHFSRIWRVWEVLHPDDSGPYMPLDEVKRWEKCTCTRNFQLSCHSQAMVNHDDVNIYSVYNMLSDVQTLVQVFALIESLHSHQKLHEKGTIHVLTLQTANCKC